MSEELLEQVRRGGETAFAELADRYRAELQLHCYRITGSVQDAEDLVQETLLAAWRGLDDYEGRATVRTWLYRIATNRCLNALRPRPAAQGGPDATGGNAATTAHPYRRACLARPPGVMSASGRCSAG